MESSTNNKPASQSDLTITQKMSNLSVDDQPFPFLRLPNELQRRIIYFYFMAQTLGGFGPAFFLRLWKEEVFGPGGYHRRLYLRNEDRWSKMRSIFLVCKEITQIATTTCWQAFSGHLSVLDEFDCPPSDDDHFPHRSIVRIAPHVTSLFIANEASLYELTYEPELFSSIKVLEFDQIEPQHRCYTRPMSDHMTLCDVLKGDRDEDLASVLSQEVIQFAVNHQLNDLVRLFKPVMLITIEIHLDEWDDHDTYDIPADKLKFEVRVCYKQHPKIEKKVWCRSPRWKSPREMMSQEDTELISILPNNVSAKVEEEW